MGIDTSALRQINTVDSVENRVKISYHRYGDRKMDDKAVWEILVPTVRNDGKPYRTRYHKVWDEKVRKISGGLTILSPAKGNWISPDGELFVERMIPVRIIASKDEIEEIVDMSLQYYDQEAILAYRISSEYILKHRA